MQKKLIKIFIINLVFFLSIHLVLASDNLAKKLSGKILLQVESVGEAYYINPTDLKKYYMGRPSDAFDLMRNFGLGIKHEELSGYLNSDFPERLTGKIMLDVENNGEAYYVYPDDLKGYYMGRPSDAFDIMKNFGLGITNENLNKISLGNAFAHTPSPTPSSTPAPMPSQQSEENNALYSAANTIRDGDVDKTLTYFIPELQKAVEYTMNFLDDDGLLTFGNILSSAKLSSSNDEEKIYITKVYFGLGGYEVEINFYVEKQDDGTWLISKI